MSALDWQIRSVQPEDYVRIAEIYRYYVTDTDITFDETAPQSADFARNAAAVCARSPYLVAESAGRVIGYCYAKPWRSMEAYRTTLESTIYLDHRRDLAATRGLGTALYRCLIHQLKQRDDAQLLLGIITGGNDISTKLHQKLGFEPIAHFHKVGRKHGRWLDVDYWGLQLR